MLIRETTYMINKGINIAETLTQCEKSDFIMRIDKAEVRQNTLTLHGTVVQGRLNGDDKRGFLNDIPVELLQAMPDKMAQNIIIKHLFPGNSATLYIRKPDTEILTQIFNVRNRVLKVVR